MSVTASRPLGMRLLRSHWTVWIGLYGLYVVGAALDAFWRSYSMFSTYDDEGYVLLSIKEFIRLGGLYNHVYSQYGPFPFELWGAVYSVLGLTVTPDNARLLVIVLWVGAGLLGGFAVHRLTGSVAAGLVSAVVSHALLTVMINEPLIPDDLCAVLVIAAVAAAVLCDGRERLRMALVGVVIGALLFTKINIGGAALAGVVTVLAVYVPGLARRPWIARTLIALGTLMPIAVMSGQLDYSWAQDLAILTAGGIAAVGVTLWPTSAEPRTDESGAGQWTALKWFGTGFVGVILIIVVVIMALGTSPAQLIDGVVIWPLKQPGAFTVADYLPGSAVELSVLGVAGAVLVRRLRGSGPIASALGGLTRVVVGLVVVLGGAGLTPLAFNSDVLTFTLAVPFLWLAIAPGSGASPRARFGRLILTVLPVYGLVFVYPVGGSQNGYAAAVCIPAATVILVDGGRQLLGVLAGVNVSFRSAGTVVGAGLLAIVGFQSLFQSAVSSSDGYATLTSMPFAGVTHVRQASTSVQAYAGLVTTLQQRCRTFVTYPGMNSFYLWTGMNPPTGFNATGWMELFSAAQQQRVVNAVQHDHGLCLITNPSVLNTWTAGGPPPIRPLLRFVTADDWKPIYTAGGYTISIRG